MSKKISELPELTGDLPSSNYIPIVHDGTTYKRVLINQINAVVVTADSYTLSDADNGKVIFIGINSFSDAWVYLDGNAFPSNGFTCSIVALTSNVKIGQVNGGVTLTGPGMVSGNWLINDATFSGVGLGATLIVKDSISKYAHLIGAIETI